ncbi:unnamed protein product [Heterobilharzia americana]|nr:unnamed protein product [Heterobilharzia americana]
MTPVGESFGKPIAWADVSSPLSMKAKVNMGTWNVHTMFEPIKAAQIAKEMRRYSIEVSRWQSASADGMEWEWTLQTVNWRINNLLQYCHPDDNQKHTEFSSGYRDVPNSIEGSHAVGTNLLHNQDHDSKVQLKRKEGHNHTMLRCAFTHNADEEKKEEFYRQLQSTLDKTPLQLAISKF